ncbi:MAG: hypothetical protein QXY87_13535 [Saccharolobus sp.]|uniref:hypothetical protein n=1 Tax=Saccharolobus TaxID=2100760 RepID=UPI001F118B2D|nr:hypothetical protein [Saccharolobus shibatae]MCH4816753.1 hypothetical protein [Saccharolobus shibatae]
MKVVLVEGISDVKFIAGLLGIKSLEKAYRDAIIVVSGYRCYKDKDILICEGGGKDNICGRAKELSEALNSKKYNFKIYILLDGDAKDVKCDIGELFYLDSKNLDELLFTASMQILSSHDYAKQLLENEKNNTDSKLKIYLIMYLFKKFIVSGERWTDLSSFFYFVAINYKSQLLSHDSSLSKLIELISS